MRNQQLCPHCVRLCRLCHAPNATPTRGHRACTEARCLLSSAYSGCFARLCSLQLTGAAQSEYCRSLGVHQLNTSSIEGTGRKLVSASWCCESLLLECLSWKMDTPLSRLRAVSIVCRRPGWAVPESSLFALRCLEGIAVSCDHPSPFTSSRATVRGCSGLGVIIYFLVRLHPTTPLAGVHPSPPLTSCLQGVVTVFLHELGFIRPGHYKSCAQGLQVSAN